jgi:hypothetical protein
MAGLVPALARDALGGSAAWPVLVVRPGSDPLAALTAAIAGHPAVADGQANVAGVLAASTDGLDRLARRLVAGPDGRVVLVVDQAEELFTISDADACASFIARLLRAAAVPGGPLTVVLTLRADFYGRLTEIPELAAAVASDHVLVGPMTDAELRAVVEEPAHIAGLRFEDGLADTIVHESPGSRARSRCCRTSCWRRGDGARAASSRASATRTPGGSTAPSPAPPTPSWTACPPTVTSGPGRCSCASSRRVTGPRTRDEGSTGGSSRPPSTPSSSPSPRPG